MFVKQARVLWVPLGRMRRFRDNWERNPRMQQAASRTKPWTIGFAVLAAVGFALSIAAHVASFQGSQGPLGRYTWTLHMGALFICIPAALAARRLLRGVPRKEQWKALLRGCPAWTKYVLYGLVAYALVNFGIFLMSPGKGGAGLMPPAAVRGFSGHWMAIYAMAFAVLYSGAKEDG